MYPDLKGKVACITGAGRRNGIGAAIAHRLASEGCKVVVSDIGGATGPDIPADKIGTSDELNQVVEDILDAGGEASAVSCNVLAEDDIIGLCSFATDTYGSLDVFVNNAGIGYLMEPLTEMSAERWDTVLGVNLRGAFLATKHAARQMIMQGNGGRIINIASQAAKSGFPFAAAYTSSKHGLV
ncbi:MAG TPA: SDR family NAD(P)-dependent oxidoreductase, partial [Xanthomonadales bacterium]|nr:SDR family NAD(P)-dependent oxidoreductase [Xanthomonadales bacterium]